MIKDGKGASDMDKVTCGESSPSNEKELDWLECHGPGRATVQS